MKDLSKEPCPKCGSGTSGKLFKSGELIVGARAWIWVRDPFTS